MPRHPLTADDLWALPRVGSPVPSPDGSLVVPVATYDIEANEGTTRLWLVPADGDAPRALTTAEASSGQPAFSPDGTRLAFVRKAAGQKGNDADATGPRHADQPQLYILPLGGGEAERVTDLPLGVIDPRWFPDGRRIAFVAPLLADAPTVDGTAELARQRGDDPVSARVTEDRVYRFWDHWLTDGRIHHLFVLDLESGTLFDLTPDSARWMGLMEVAGQYRIEPDGTEIAFGASRSDPPHDPLLWGVYTVKVPARIGPRTRARKPVLISRGQRGHARRPVYSPDGRYIVYGVQREIDFYADKTRLVAFDRQTRKHTVLTEDWDRSAEGWTFGDDPGTVILAAEEAARKALFRLDLRRALRDPSRNPPREMLRGGWLGAPEVAGDRVLFTRQSLSEPPEVYGCALDGADPRRLTAFTAPVMDDIALGEVEEIFFEGAGGDEVQMFVVHPPGARRAKGRKAKAARPKPLVHMIHGGPHGVFGDQWHWRWNTQAFAAPGYVVALVNFHGSTGWGQDFAASILGSWGDQPYQDIMAATDELIDRSLADPERMAVTGGSYGGYLVSWIAGQTDRFACIVNHAGVCDFQTQYASDITQGRRRSLGGEVWDDIEGLDRYNPMRHAAGFASPMLVIHGEKDYRVPHAQGIGIYNVYKAKGLPARLVVYPDENHWILKPRNSQYWYGEVLGWLERWLGR